MSAMMLRVERVAWELKERKIEVSLTRLMYEVMNETTDQEMYEMDSDLVDVAEKIEYYMERLNTNGDRKGSQ